MIGSLLASRYRIQAQLGQGGMGVVHEAIDETTGARVAVKLVHAEMIREASSKDDASKLTRFMREAKAAAAIQGEHVARTLDWGTDETSGRPFIVMELLDGEDLQEALKRVNVLPPDVALRIAAQACEGLVQAHLARVIHRDIKPANLFLARLPSGEIVVKILDFGIAKIRPEGQSDGEATALTRTGTMLGSPKYMSPEQARGVRSLDNRTDVWSLGVVLFRMLTGHVPHEDITAIGEFIIMLCSEAPEIVQTYSPWVSAAAQEVVEDALRIDRDKRYESAAAMLAALRAMLPGGDGLRAEEIVSFDASAQAGAPKQARSQRSRTGERSGDGPRERSAEPEGLLLTASGEATSQMPSRSSVPPPVAPRRDDSATTGAMGGVPVDAVSARPRRTLPFAIGMGVGAVILLGMVFALSRGADFFSNRPVASAASSAEQPRQGASADASRQANVVVLPSDALVEIDGVVTTPVDGVIKIVGAIGSTHRVRISKEKQEKIAEVVLGPSGAEPPKVELVLAAPTVSAAPTAKAPGAPHGPTKKLPAPGAPPTATNPLIPERFE